MATDEKGLLPGSQAGEPPWLRRSIIALVVLFLGVVLILPLALILSEAFAGGIAGYVHAFQDADTWSAIRLTLLATGVSVLLNTIFGIAAAWTVVRSGLPFTSILLGIIDIPFAVSPVIAGLFLVLLYGAHGWFGGWLRGHGLHIIFGTTGIIMATTFVTLPFVVRELVPTLQLLGTQEEEAARLLGASAWTSFWRITLPGLRWSLFYGITLCSARALGEFGAVSVVSGHPYPREDLHPAIAH